MISQCCLEEDPEHEKEILLILGYLTEDIEGYSEAIHARNREALKALLEADRVNRQRELECSLPPNEQILAFAQSKTASVATKFDQLITSLASPKDESWDAVRSMYRTRYCIWPANKSRYNIFAYKLDSSEKTKIDIALDL